MSIGDSADAVNSAIIRDIEAEGPPHFPLYVGDAQRCSPGIWVGLILACASSTPVLRHFILAIFEFCYDIPFGDIEAELLSKINPKIRWLNFTVLA
jgi:hypothetical protein